MIHLILNEEKTPHLFDKETVILGNSPLADISLSGEALIPEHIKIVQTEGVCTIINCANDPFVTLNGLPFGKKIAKEGDLIEVGSHTLQLAIAAEEKIAPPMHTPLPESDASSTFLEKESLETIDELSEEEETAPPSDQEAPAPPRVLGKNIVFIVSISSFFLLVSLFFTMSYFILSKKSDGDELKATHAVADAAMALLYAQVHELSPSQKNWAEPEFLKQTLQKILPNTSSPLFSLDVQGQLRKHQYLLRIYTTNRFSRFIVIAQPEHSLLHSIFPKPTIIIDSKEMKLRKMKELKALNRLLVNYSVEDSFPRELELLIQQSPPLCLNKLAKRKSSRSFAFPKALAHIRPKGQFLIYNAQRYSLFGQKLLEKAWEVKERSKSLPPPFSTRKQVELLAPFQNMVYYSSSGRNGAVTTQHTLSELHLASDLIAYATSEGNKEYHFLMSENPLPFIPQEKWGNMAIQTSSPITSHSPLVHPLLSRPKIPPTNQSLTMHLIALSSKFKRALAPRYNEMKQLLGQKEKILSQEMITKLRRSLKAYEAGRKQEGNQLLPEILHLYEQHPSVSLPKFLSLLKEHHLGTLLQPPLIEDLEKLAQTTERVEAIHAQLKKIQKANQVDELNSLVEETDLLLKKNIPKEVRKALTTKLQSYTLMKIDHILLQKPVLGSHPDEEEVEKLLSFLNSAETIPEEERLFYQKALSQKQHQ